MACGPFLQVFKIWNAALLFVVVAQLQIFLGTKPADSVERKAVS